MVDRQQADPMKSFHLNRGSEPRADRDVGVPAPPVPLEIRGTRMPATGSAAPSGQWGPGGSFRPGTGKPEWRRMRTALSRRTTVL